MLGTWGPIPYDPNRCLSTDSRSRKMSSPRTRPPKIPFDQLSAETQIWFLTIFHSDVGTAAEAAARGVHQASLGDDGRDPSGLYCCFNDAAVVRYGRCFYSARCLTGQEQLACPPATLPQPLPSPHCTIKPYRCGTQSSRTPTYVSEKWCSIEEQTKMTGVSHGD